MESVVTNKNLGKLGGIFLAWSFYLVELQASCTFLSMDYTTFIFLEDFFFFFFFLKLLTCNFLFLKLII